MTPQDATPQLLDLAIASRPDWDRDLLAGEIAAVKARGWVWDDILTAIVRLMRREGSEPRDLTPHPPMWSRGPAPGPDVAARGAAAVRAAIEHRQDGDDDD